MIYDDAMHLGGGLLKEEDQRERARRGVSERAQTRRLLQRALSLSLSLASCPATYLQSK